MLNQFHSSTTEAGQNSPGPLGPKGGGERGAFLQLGQLGFTKRKDGLTWGSTPLAPPVEYFPFIKIRGDGCLEQMCVRKRETEIMYVDEKETLRMSYHE